MMGGYIMRRIVHGDWRHQKMEQSLIDKDKLVESMVWRDDQGMILSIDDVLDTIDTAPTIDPESLRPKAHWIYDGRIDKVFGMRKVSADKGLARRTGGLQRPVARFDEQQGRNPGTQRKANTGPLRHHRGNDKYHLWSRRKRHEYI